jgi:hypothetical protein
VPAHALGWQRHKPWYWFPGIYFNVHWVWAHHRAVFLQESFVLFNCIAVAAIIATAILSGAPLDAAVQALLKGNREPLPPLVGANANSGGGASTGGANGAGGGGGAGAGNANTGNGVDKLNGADGTVDASGVPSAGAAATSGGVLGRAALKISVGLGQLVSSIGWNIPGLVSSQPCRSFHVCVLAS